MERWEQGGDQVRKVEARFAESDLVGGCCGWVGTGSLATVVGCCGTAGG